ncbi:MAG: response regulator [Deltaproteobacteria bacterium]|nr:response regulator [Deltaproteobacteria bacterium]MBI3060479.1 response regulator [Deltaproteobacteria bacterium]
MAGAGEDPIRVLLVDHDASEVMATRFLLARVAEARFIVDEAGSLSAALQRLTKRDIDIVLLDSTLPDSDGLEALGTLRSRYPDTPVIMLAGAGDRQWVSNALEMGARDCIVKDNVNSYLLARIILRHAKKP